VFCCRNRLSGRNTSTGQKLAQYLWVHAVIVNMTFNICIFILSGTFWQLTDVHYDPMYNDPSLHPSICRSADTGVRNSTGKSEAGKYGDYNCDAPWELVVSAIDAMNSIEPQPDFILWTGYSRLSHVMLLLAFYHNCKVYRMGRKLDCF